jgi:hypothetical protein
MACKKAGKHDDDVLMSCLLLLLEGIEMEMVSHRRGGK